MKNFIFFFAIIALLTSSYVSKSNADKCPVCTAPQYKTGATKIEYAKIVHEYKCGLNHSFWKPVEGASASISEEEKTSASCNCPICGHPGHITAQPGVMKCGNEHEFGCE